MKPIAVVLVARSAVAAAPLREMQRLAHVESQTRAGAHVTFAFTEQGDPSLRDVVHRLRDQPFAEIVLVPLLLPMEPSGVAFLTHVVQRWRETSPGPWPTIRLGRQSPAETTTMPAMLHELIDSAIAGEPIEPSIRGVPDGSIVPALRRRVLVCAGGPCNAVGASAIWGHLRNEQKRLNLKDAGVGSAKTSCLGPCKLAPVVQVYPEGVFYGGVDEQGIDRIIQEHLRDGRTVP